MIGCKELKFSKFSDVIKNQNEILIKINDNQLLENEIKELLSRNFNFEINNKSNKIFYGM
jgi:hypothetical protein